MDEQEKLVDEQEKLGENLVKFRKLSGLTQLELADKIQYSNKTVSKWERGESYPDIFTLQKIADIYGVTVDNILSGVTPKEQETLTLDTKSSKYVFKRGMLIMACALLFCLTLVGFFVLTFLVGAGKREDGSVIISAVSGNVNGHMGYGYWTFFIYNIPLDALAIFIFLLAVHKRADQWSLSLIIWGILMSIHLSVMQYEPLTALIYLCGIPFQIFTAAFCRYVNIFMRAKKQEILENKKENAA